MAVKKNLDTALLLIVGVAFGYGAYEQFVTRGEAHPRPFLIAVSGIAFIGLLQGFGRISSRIYGGMMALASLIGAGIAGRQVWLQHLPPDKVPACGPGLDYILDTFPLSKALKMVLSGSGECAEVQWQFLGFSIAEWSLFCFLLLIAASLVPIVMHMCRCEFIRTHIAE